MRRFAAVALREIAERRFVLVAAAVVSTIPILLPLLEKASGLDAVQERSISALMLCVGWGLAAALLVGASVVGRELAEKRLSFYFARPLPPAVIWGGKLAGGLGLVVAVEAIILLPATLANGQIPAFSPSFLEAVPLAVILLHALPFFLLAWAGSVALRSRSLWLAVDFVLASAVAGVLVVVGRRFVSYGQVGSPSILLAAVGVLTAALLVATYAQVAAGRTDSRRGHGAQSATLWGLLLVATAAASFWAERKIDPGVGRLVHVWTEPADSGGDWVSVDGSADEDVRGRTRYLVNLRDGRSHLLPPGGMATCSSDGSRAAWLQYAPFERNKFEVKSVDLKSGEDVVLAYAEWPDGLALSDDGRRLAVVSQGLCSVFELPSLRSLASARVPSSRWAYRPRFITGDLVRLFPRRSWRSSPRAPSAAPPALEDPVVSDFDVARKAVTTLATYPVSSIPVAPSKSPSPASGSAFQLLSGPDLSRVLVVGLGQAHGVRLLDASSGRVLASVDGSEETGRPIGVFLADGRAVVSEPVSDGRRLVLLALDGSRQSEIALPAGTKHVRFGYEPTKGKLAVGLGRDVTAQERDWYLADLSSGHLKPLGVDALSRAFWSGIDPIPAPGSPATRLALEKGSGRLVLFDPSTGSQTPITRGGTAGK